MNFQFTLRSEKDPQGPKLYVYFPCLFLEKRNAIDLDVLALLRPAVCSPLRVNAVHSQQVTRKN